VKVAVLMGGKSSEREISVQTGTQISSALMSKGYDVFTLELDENTFGILLTKKPDAVFIALHGRYGEDGCVQGMLEIAGIPYVGSGVLASAIAMDKVTTKVILARQGIRSPLGKVISINDWRAVDQDQKDTLTGLMVGLSYPVVVKPNQQGSTLGLTIVDNIDRLRAGLEHAFLYDDVALVEEFVMGTEITVSVIGNKKPIVLPTIEIISHTGLYDYKAKYTKGLSEHIIPARIGPEREAEAEETALRCFKALGCRDMARVDMIVPDEGELCVLEVNTIPGMTETSLMPDAARAYGIQFPDLAEMLVKMSVRGHQDLW